MQAMDATQWAGPIVLFFLMVAVGLELTPADFRRVLKVPRAVVGGTLAQIVLLPAMTWALVVGLDVSPILGAGAVIVAVSPGAGISNILVLLGRANAALSVTLTAVASVLCVVTLPTIAALGLEIFLGDAVDIEVPVLRLMVQLVLTLLLPIGVGMRVRATHPEFVARYGRRLQSAMLGLIVVMTALAIVFADGGDVGVSDLVAGFGAAAVWTAAGMGIGWTVARALRLPEADRFTFLIEFSARNIGVAAIVAMSGLGRVDLALFSGAYVMVGYPMAVTAVLIRRRRLAARSGADATLG